MSKNVFGDEIIENDLGKLPPEEPKANAIAVNVFGDTIISDPATPIGPDEVAPTRTPVIQDKSKFALMATGAGVGAAVSGPFAPIGAIIGGGLGAMANKGYEGGIKGEYTEGPDKGKRIPYTEQLKAFPEGALFGGTMAVPELRAGKMAGGIAKSALAGSKGFIPAVKTIGRETLAQAGLNTVGALPYELEQQIKNNPDAPLSSAALNSLLYGAVGGGVTATGMSRAAIKGAGVLGKSKQFYPFADDAAKILKESGAQPVTAAQMQKAGEAKNKMFNIVKNLWGGGSLKELESSHIADLTKYQTKLMDDILNGVPTDKALRGIEIQMGQDKTAQAITGKQSAINIKGIKEESGVATISKMQDYTKQADNVIDSIRSDAGKVLGAEIPKDPAGRSQLFTQEYNKVFDAIDSTGKRIDTKPIRETVGIPPAEAETLARNNEWLSKLSPADQATAKRQLGVSGNTGDFDKILESGRIQGFTTNSAKRLVSSMAENPTFREAHALRSVFGAEAVGTKDPAVANIFREAKKAITEQMDKTARAAGDNQFNMWKNTDHAYNQAKVYEELSDKMVSQYTEQYPVINKPVIKGKELTEYLRKNEQDLLNVNKLSPDKLNELKRISSEAFNSQDKGAALRNVTDDLKVLYDKFDNITLQESIALEDKLTNLLESKNLSGADTSRINKTVTRLRDEMAKSAEASGVGKEWQATRNMMQKDKLHAKLTDIFSSNSITSLDKNIGEARINGVSLWNALDKQSDTLTKTYGIEKGHLESLKNLARTLAKIEAGAETGAGVATGMQMSPAVFPNVTNPSWYARIGSVTGIPKVLSKFVLNQPYVLGSADATKLLAHEIEKMAGTSGKLGAKSGMTPYMQMANIWGKAYAAWELDTARQEQASELKYDKELRNKKFMSTFGATGAP